MLMVTEPLSPCESAWLAEVSLERVLPRAVGAGERNGLCARTARPGVHDRQARCLVGDPLLVEPEVEGDPELDDSDHEDQQWDQDERELDRRLAALRVTGGRTAEW